MHLKQYLLRALLLAVLSQRLYLNDLYTTGFNLFTHDQTTGYHTRKCPDSSWQTYSAVYGFHGWACTWCEFAVLQELHWAAACLICEAWNARLLYVALPRDQSDLLLYVKSCLHLPAVKVAY